MTITLAPAPSFRLDGKRALVSGAGRGIGLAAASVLAEAGAHVTLASRTATEIEEAAAAIRARGHKADALVLDVSDLGAMQRSVWGFLQGLYEVATACDVQQLHAAADAEYRNATAARGSKEGDLP